jgi:5-methylcytosine-specific restriction protein B
MEKIKKENLQGLIKDYLEWYNQSEHKNYENSYEMFQTKAYWENLSEEELVESLYEFVAEGGKIQSGGHRIKNRFRKSLIENINLFRNQLLSIFDADFDLKKWWLEMNKMDHFGIGTRSIFLHRINPKKYWICNDKSLAGLVEIGYLKTIKSDTFEKYIQIKEILDKVIQDSSFNMNYFQIDSLFEYIIGMDEGKIWLNEPQNGENEEIKNEEYGIMGKIIIANITWNSNDWKNVSKDPSNFGQVKDGTKPNESFNFDFENNSDENNRVYGYVQFTQNRYPKFQGRGNLIVFYSNGKIVGFYGDAAIEREIVKINDWFKNISGDRNLSFVLETKIEDIKTKGYLEDKERVGHIGFSYISNKMTVINILSEAERLNPNQKDKIKKLKDWVESKFGNSTVSSTNPRSDSNVQNENTNSYSGPKNLILYGPPGTGKTYLTKKKALEIICGKQTVKKAIENDKFIIDPNIQKEYDKLFNENKDQIMFTTFHQTYSYEQFVEGISVLTDENDNSQPIYKVRDGIFKQANNLAKVSQKPVVLIIDEINRGNISKIFGELITLIEDDKRAGKENAIIVSLPYSEFPQNQFSVQPNLYIIGTMNTADRSLVQLDTALRRRFVFEEMMPKYKEQLGDDWKNFNEDWKDKSNNNIDLSLFLEKLNQKICKEYDREHQIGHAYLMKVDNFEKLKIAWENKIMPLLQEYFYADYEKLAKVIGVKDEGSNYLKKIKPFENKNDYSWVLNMKAGEGKFTEEFKKVYKSVTGEPIESDTVKQDSVSDEITETS